MECDDLVFDRKVLPRLNNNRVIAIRLQKLDWLGECELQAIMRNPGCALSDDAIAGLEARGARWEPLKQTLSDYRHVHHPASRQAQGDVLHTEIGLLEKSVDLRQALDHEPLGNGLQFRPCKRHSQVATSRPPQIAGDQDPRLFGCRELDLGSLACAKQSDGSAFRLQRTDVFQSVFPGMLVLDVIAQSLVEEVASDRIVTSARELDLSGCSECRPKRPTPSPFQADWVAASHSWRA